MKKGGFLRNVLDTIRSNQATGSSARGGSGGPNDRGYEFGGQLKPSHFSLCQVARHGYPEHPTAVAFDPVQKIAAIGTKSGALHIFGRPGADVWVQHEPAYAVTHIRFVINQGALITVTADESIHLWSLRGPNLKLQFSTGGQAAAGSSPLGSSPAPTPASNISSISPQSSGSVTAIGHQGASHSTATSPSSFLGQISDSVSGAVDTASDFLTGGALNDHFPVPSPTSDTRQSVAYKYPEILHTLRFQREHITYIHQTLTSKWLYIGTERGNVHVANVETFELSGYSIAWNKAIELSRKAHPGAIIHLSECPQDTNKLLIGYDSGYIVLWDLKQRNADGRYYHTENLLWLAWHYEGKQFVAAHGDGSLATWQTRSNQKPMQIQYPHAKTAGGGGQLSAEFSSSHLSSGNLVRSLNNELYRPIKKVEWKISKSNNEQFYLFSGGLPYDGFDQQQTQPEANRSQLRPSTVTDTSPRAATPGQGNKTAMSLTSPFPVSPSMSPNLQQQHQEPTRAPTHVSQTRERKSMRSTSLTVMYGKSITVLEMDDTIIDFITICENSPYENDTSDPYAVIVLLSSELILIDLTSSGYPSFDSPYSSASLNESPVTCVQYLADCSSDLIPFLYSTSQNVVSRAPKKGFSDKEWPINGGEWGQSMQSYPELVLTGHADGTIKFWDMSGVNFDLISKIKTSKLFDKPNKPPNAVFVSINASPGSRFSSHKRAPATATAAANPSGTAEQHDQCSMRTHSNDPLSEKDQTAFDEGIFAIEKIEFCTSTKRLLVAGACAQVIQFKLNKKEAHSSSSSSSSSAVPAADSTTILVEPLATHGTGLAAASGAEHGPNQAHWRQHSLLKVRGSQTGSAAGAAAGPPSGGSSSSSGSNRSRSGLSGFSVELICLSPLLTSTVPPNENFMTVAASNCGAGNQSSAGLALYCQVPPKITAIAFQAMHNILAYAHTNGIVLIDVIQKCVIINASLSDLYGGAASSSLSNRDISIQPYATSSILQHHYQAASSTSSTFVGGPAACEPSQNEHNKQSGNGTAGHHQQLTNDNERTMESTLNDKLGVVGLTDGGQHASPPKSIDVDAKSDDQVLNEHIAAHPSATPQDEQMKVTSIVSECPSSPESTASKQCEKFVSASVNQTESEQDITRTSATTPNPANNEGIFSSLFSKLIEIQLDQTSKTSISKLQVHSSCSQRRTAKRLSSQLERRPPPIKVTHSMASRARRTTVSSHQLMVTSPTLTKKPPATSLQSRYTNSMFQRQLSTNALSTGPNTATSTGCQAIVAATSSPSAKPPSRLFQRQMTTSQLFANSSGSGSISTASGHQQDKKRPQTNARSDLTFAVDQQSTMPPNRTGSAVAAAAAATVVATEMAGGNSVTGNNKKPAKNKRIISRMLSISAIHTSAGSSINASPTANYPSLSDTSQAATVLQQVHSTAGQSSIETCQSTQIGGSSGGTGAGSGGGVGSGSFGEQRSDKFDSSFRRSRSSSTSSNGAGSQSASGDPSHYLSESIQCLTFVDPGQTATSCSSLALGTSSLGGPNANVAGSGAQAAGSVQSSASGGSNHKSLSPIDTAIGQLSLWLGTSTGGLLLVSLQMPDNEDNRVLQLQSINAEPIPQTSIKLGGQILCLATFTCEARSQAGGLAGAHGATAVVAANSSTSQSSSLEGDVLLQSPSSIGSPISASINASSSPISAAGAPPGGSNISSGFGSGDGANLSFDSRSSLFLAVVSEKHARVYQVPSQFHLQQQQQQQQQQQHHHGASQTQPSSGSGKSSSSSSSTDHHAHHAGSSSSSAAKTIADTPLANLLTNKRYLIAECDISDTSFACCSSVMQMRNPEESCLVSYLANGNIVVHSLPRLRPVLFDVDFVPLTNPMIANSMRFARNGHCLYRPSPGEISKFTISAQYKALVNDMLGLVYVPREMPEMPRTNFFKSLFSVSQSAKQSDRDELFGECSAGKPVRGVAKHFSSVAGTASSGGGGGSQLSSMDKLKGAAVGTMGHDLRLAREGLDERGEKLSEMEDQTLRMMNHSEAYAQAAHQLAQKFKDKKWYQF